MTINMEDVVSTVPCDEEALGFDSSNIVLWHVDGNFLTLCKDVPNDEAFRRCESIKRILAAWFEEARR